LLISKILIVEFSIKLTSLIRNLYSACNNSTAGIGLFFYDIFISQGSVATCLEFGGIFSDYIVAYLQFSEL